MDTLRSQKTISLHLFSLLKVLNNLNLNTYREMMWLSETFGTRMITEHSDGINLSLWQLTHRVQELMGNWCFSAETLLVKKKNRKCTN